MLNAIRSSSMRARWQRGNSQRCLERVTRIAAAPQSMQHLRPQPVQDRFGLPLASGLARQNGGVDRDQRLVQLTELRLRLGDAAEL